MSEKNGENLSIYEITNRTTGSKHFVADTNAQAACEQLGWLIGDCYVNLQKPQSHWTKEAGVLRLVKIPCRICPLQYAECTKPLQLVCPIRPSSPELQSWLKQAAKARLCPYVGVSLSKKDHEKAQKWVKKDTAVKELTPKP